MNDIDMPRSSAGSKSEAVVNYPIPLHEQTAYREFPRASLTLPVAEKLSTTAMSLPMHPYLKTQGQDHIIAAVASSLAQWAVAIRNGGKRCVGSADL